MLSDCATRVALSSSGHGKPRGDVMHTKHDATSPPSRVVEVTAHAASSEAVAAFLPVKTRDSPTERESHGRL
jgi:hypothetical protein